MASCLGWGGGVWGSGVWGDFCFVAETYRRIPGSGDGQEVWFGLLKADSANVQTADLSLDFHGTSGVIDLNHDRDIKTQATLAIKDPTLLAPYRDFVAVYLNRTYDDTDESESTQLGLFGVRVPPGTRTIERADAVYTGHDLTATLARYAFTDAALSAAVGITKGGTGQTTANAALNALLPTQTSNAGKILSTDASNASWIDSPPNIVPGWTSGRWYSIQQMFAMDWGQVLPVSVANRIYATPLWVPRGGAAIDRVGVAVQTGVAASTARLMLHAPLTNGLPGALLFDWGTVSTATGGDKEITISATLPAGLVLLTCVVSAAVTLYGFESYGTGIFGNSSQAGSEGSPYRDNGSMTAPNPWGTTGISYSADRTARLAVRAA